MNSRVIDLTGDSSDIEPATLNIMPRVKRQALKAVGNGPPGKKAEEPPESVELSTALKRAIESMSHDRLKTLVKHYCKSIEPLRNKLEENLLVAGQEVVRYHIDSDSENLRMRVNHIDQLVVALCLSQMRIDRDVLHKRKTAIAPRSHEQRLSDRPLTINEPCMIAPADVP